HLRRLQRDVGGKAGEHPHREYVAVGELDDVEYAEEQGEANGDQRVHNAKHEAVDQVLKRDVHAVNSRVGKTRATTRSAPSPLVGEGWGGVVRMWRRSCVALAAPPPTPSPKGGRGAHRIRGRE